MTDQSLRAKIGFYLDDSETSQGKIINLSLLGFNLFACILFVISISALEEPPPWVTFADAVVISFFVIEYILRLWCAESKGRYILSVYGLIDLFSILPSFMPLQKLAFLRGLKVLRALRFIRFLETESFFFGRLSRLQLQLARTFFTIFVILFISSGFIMISEADAPRAYIHGFFEAFYFCVTTLATVGFGDLVPVTDSGRWITIIMILSGAILVPWQAGKLVRLLISVEAHKRPVTCPSCGLTGHDRDASHCKSCGAVIYQEYEGDIG